MHRLLKLIFHGGLRAAVNLLRPRPLLKTIQTCWIILMPQRN